MGGEILEGMALCQVGALTPTIIFMDNLTAEKSLYENRRIKPKYPIKKNTWQYVDHNN